MTITQEFADGEIRVVKETDEDGDGEWAPKSSEEKEPADA